VSQDSSLKEDESRPHDHTDQAADETQTQTSEEAEPMAVHFADNSKLSSQIIVSYKHFQKVTNISRTGVEDNIEGKIVKKNVDTLG